MPPPALTDEDKKIWEQVAQTVTPLDPPQTNTADITTAPNAPPASSFKDFSIGELAKPEQTPHHFAPTIGDNLAAAPNHMDRKLFTKMKRGKLRPEAVLDLHGMTLAHAHRRLTQFVIEAAAHKMRLILVITGKGKSNFDDGPIPIRPGVLRHQVPQWLSQSPLKALVLQIAQAHQTHGGGGAYYVYLRRAR